MEFLETRLFTRRVIALGLEEELRQLQLELQANPLSGPVEPGAGGLRKVRMADRSRGMGKSGGARVHYLALPHKNRVYLLFVYTKDDMDALSSKQKEMLRKVVDAIKRAG